MKKDNEVRQRILDAFQKEGAKTITDVAKLLGVGKMTFNNYVNNARRFPPPILAEMEKRTGRRAEWFLTGEENPGDIGYSIAYKINLIGKLGDPQKVETGKELADMIDKKLDEIIETLQKNATPR